MIRVWEWVTEPPTLSYTHVVCFIYSCSWRRQSPVRLLVSLIGWVSGCMRVGRLSILGRLASCRLP